MKWIIWAMVMIKEGSPAALEGVLGAMNTMYVCTLGMDIEKVKNSDSFQV